MNRASVIGANGRAQFIAVIDLSCLRTASSAQRTNLIAGGNATGLECMTIRP